MAKRILVLNPNTSESVTRQVLAHCRQRHDGVVWDGVTARLGSPYIATETAYAVAAHAVLEAYAEHYDGHDAVLLACFGDPGLLALQELAAVPVVGLARSSFVAAARHGRFGVVTGGLAWEPMLWRFARAQQLDANLVGVYTAPLTGAEIAAAPAQARDMLLSEARRAVHAGARVILLGGAALAGMDEALQGELPVPVLDNVALAAQAVVLAASNMQRVLPQPLRKLPMQGVGASLTALLQGA